MRKSKKHNGTIFFWMIQITPKTSLCRKTDFSLDSQFVFPPPHSGLFRNNVFYMSRIIKILSSFAKKSSWQVLIRSCQDLTKVFQEILSIKILARCVKFCTSWQDLAWHGKVYQVSFHWVRVQSGKYFSKIILNSIIQINLKNQSVKLATEKKS